METAIFDNSLNKWWLVTDEIGNTDSNPTGCVVAAYGNSIDDAVVEVDKILDKFNRKEMKDILHMVREKDHMHIIVPDLKSYNSSVWAVVLATGQDIRRENMN